MADWIKELYLNLMNDGISLYEIDEMDIYYYIDLLCYKANKKVKTQIKAMDDAGL